MSFGGGRGGRGLSNKELREQGYSWGEIHSGAARNEEHAKAIESGERDLSGNAMHQVGKAINEKISGSMSWGEYQQKTADTIRKNFKASQQDSDSDSDSDSDNYHPVSKPKKTEKPKEPETPEVPSVIDVEAPPTLGGGETSAESKDDGEFDDIGKPIGGFEGTSGDGVVRAQPQEYADLANRIKDAGIHQQAVDTNNVAVQNQQNIVQTEADSGYSSTLLTSREDTGSPGLGNTGQVLGEDDEDLLGLGRKRRGGGSGAIAR